MPGNDCWCWRALIRYFVIHPGRHDFEAKNPGALFVALSRAKSSGGHGIDPDFAFHEDFLANEDRFRAVDAATTQARAREMVRLRALTEETRNRQSLSPAYQEETFHRLVEWEQSMNVKPPCPVISIMDKYEEMWKQCEQQCTGKRKSDQPFITLCTKVQNLRYKLEM
ncbi:hypothetical protein OS493_001146 [Desmophyllum pertusum]|uniref:Uncharacterized protein n=1 Tax=Desmophyllum pertusum TaxID=174260 RepID=A0A9W9ZTW3_9CNID|nr:hypothetical protein OS493_001146 [Desmophyllum pertusum]